jgi:hypothetical protein
VWLLAGAAALVMLWRVFALQPGSTPDLMLARPCPPTERCHQSWTLTSRLGAILEKYEKLVGPRDTTYRVLGVEFTTQSYPRIWYPDFGSGTRSVIVQLTEPARQNLALALFQLGHEAFHLLEPLGPGKPTSNWEEGLASYFAVQYLRGTNIGNGEAFLTERGYRAAYDQVVLVAGLHEDFHARLRRMRAGGGSIARAAADDIRAAFPKVPVAVAAELARPFAGGDGGR